MLRGRLLFDYIILFLKFLFFFIWDLHHFKKIKFKNLKLKKNKKKTLIHYALYLVFGCWLTVGI